MTSPSQTLNIMKAAALILTGLLLGGLYFFYASTNSPGLRNHETSAPQTAQVSEIPTTLIAPEKRVNLNPPADIGEATYVGFWAEWCLPCHAELPLIAKLQAEGALHAVLINVDTDPAMLEQARTRLQKDAPNVANIWDADGTWRAHLKPAALPFHFLVDIKGRIAAAFYGDLTKETESFKSLVQPLQAE